MKTLSCIITVFSLIFCAAAVQANEVKDLERAASHINAQAKTSDGQAHVLTKISDETGVPVATLQTQRSQTDLGYGELLIANSLASATGKTFEEIAALKASGQGWGKIAKTYDLKLGPIVSQARHADEALTSTEAKGKKKGKGNDDDFFTDTGNGAGAVRDLEHGHGHDMAQSQGQGNGGHGSKSQGQGQSKAKGKGP